MSVTQLPAEPPPVVGYRAPEGVSPFKLFEVLWRRRGTLVFVMCLVLLAAVPKIVLAPSRYEAISLVLVDTRQNKLSDLQAIVTGTQSEVIEVRTQVDILRSPAMAEQVVNRLDLVREKEFAAALVPSLLDWRVLMESAMTLAGVTPIPRPPLTEDEKIRLVSAMLVNDKLTIVNDGRSYVIGINVKTEDGELSARIANTYARVYLDFNRELKDRAVTRASAWLDERLAPLQQKLRASERAASAFRAANGLVQDGVSGANGERPSTVAGQQLAQINSQLVTATAERQEKEATVAEIRRALQGNGDLYAVPAVVSSLLIQRLRGAQADLGAREASLALQHSDGSPALMALRAERRDTEARIRQEAMNIVASIESEANASRAREASLRQSLQDAQAQVAEQNKAQIRLHELESEAEAARTVYMDYLNRSERSSNERDIQQPDAELISLASVPMSVAPPTKRQFLLLASLAAGLAGVLAALVRERLEPGFRTAEQIETETGLMSLGIVPRAARRRRALLLDPRDFAYGEAIGHVRSVLMMAGVAGHPRVVLVTSALPREGKTFFAVSLARSVAQAGGRCLLIDCDLRRPSVSGALGIAAEPGLGPDSLPADATTPTSGLVDALVRRDAASTLDIITAGAGRADASALVASPRLRALVAEARERYDLVVIDAPPVLAFVDARVLSQVADSTVLLVRWRRTQRAMVQASLKALRTYGGRIAGTVLSQVDMRALAAYEGNSSDVLRKYGPYKH